MRKVLIIGAGVLALCAIFILKYNSSPNPTSQAPITNNTKLAENKPSRYSPPYTSEKPLHRPEITVDENSNPRWIRNLEESSLRGSTVDRPAIVYDEEGIISLSPDINFYFSYFLSLSGEMAPQRIHQIVYDDIYANYPSKVADQFYALFNRYLRYDYELGKTINQLDLATIQKEKLTEDSVKQEIQKRYFTAEEIQVIFREYEQRFKFTPQGTRIAEKLFRYSLSSDEDRKEKAAELFGEEAAKRLTEPKEAN